MDIEMPDWTVDLDGTRRMIRLDCEASFQCILPTAILTILLPVLVLGHMNQGGDEYTEKIRIYGELVLGGGLEGTRFA